MEVLPFYPQPGYTVESEPRTLVAEFGDGYKQRRRDGLNALLKSYNLTFNLKHQQAVQLDAFFAKLGGVEPFLFKEHETAKQAKVVCTKWSKTVKKHHTQIQCDFEEVV